MTPNLTSARQAIQAELSHARQGAAFYTARVEALETTLSQLESMDTDDTALLDMDADTRATIKASAKKQAGKRGRPARKAESPSHTGRKKASDAPTRTRRGRRPATEQTDLPTTGADFWLKLITDEPKSAVEIANAAAAHLGLGSEQKNQVQKLKQRVAPALATLVSTQKIQHVGAGRQRRYFLDSGKQTAA